MMAMSSAYAVTTDEVGALFDCLPSGPQELICTRTPVKVVPTESVSPDRIQHVRARAHAHMHAHLRAPTTPIPIPHAPYPSPHAYALTHTRTHSQSYTHTHVYIFCAGACRSVLALL